MAVDGRAPRLAPDEAIDVARPLGRWRQVDPSTTMDGWRVVGLWTGIGLWAGVVAATGALGWWRGIGPLGAVREVRTLGSTLSGPRAVDADLASPASSSGRARGDAGRRAGRRP